MEILLKATLLGIVAGTVTTSTAIGWGILTMPALVLYFRLLPHVAVSISVVGFILCVLSMTIFWLQSGNIDWPLTLAISVGVAVTSRGSASRPNCTSRRPPGRSPTLARWWGTSA